MNTIPGADALGFGFDILGRYDLSSVTSRVFLHKNNHVRDWTYQPTGITYAVPDNTAVFDDTNPRGEVTTKSTREKFQNEFSGKAGIKASYGAFSGEFDSAFSHVETSDHQFYWSMYDAEFTGWRLALETLDASYVNPAFLQAVEDLPTPFNDEVQNLYFNVLRTYGTHFVTQVEVNGSFRYYVAVDKSYSSNQTDVSAKVDLEYQAVFASAKARASAEWKQLGEHWAKSRYVKVSAQGGDTGPLNALSPKYGDNYNDVFTHWQKAVMRNPSAVRFRLRPLSVLFDHNQEVQIALDAAISKYTNGALYSTSIVAYDYQTKKSECTWNIIQSGTVVPPNPDTAPPQYPPAPDWPHGGGLQVALLNPVTLDTILSKVHYVKDLNPNAIEIYDRMMADIDKVADHGYLAVVTAFGMPLWLFPPRRAFTWFESCGATLEEWRRRVDQCANAYTCNYVMIGRNGLAVGNATERFSTQYHGSKNTMDIAAFELLFRGNSRLMLSPAAA